MLRLLLPLLLAAVGLAAGTGAGILLRPAPEPPEPAAAAAEEKPHEVAPADGHASAEDPEDRPEYAKLNNQFIVPVLEGGRVAAMVILSLSLEVPHGGTEDVYAVEPKLRDGMLRVLFDHANAGGFEGSFTEAANLVVLRRALLEVAQSVLGPRVKDVLIVDIMRQDS
ncbi:flagellar basal body-associated FliL family protein [Rhodobacter sp. CZR27]|uniref:flagellar basal body-associated FliL family protein n=1 Tax=Rhodobacter sp. CZR27 TaxID=2033869 RepID=UPI000BBEA564|nr:flagellar basal body-associated FliL family protein [Rhodobacter sp. CZR27]